MVKYTRADSLSGKSLICFVSFSLSAVHQVALFNFRWPWQERRFDSKRWSGEWWENTWFKAKSRYKVLNPRRVSPFSSRDSSLKYLLGSFSFYSKRFNTNATSKQLQYEVTSSSACSPWACWSRPPLSVLNIDRSASWSRRPTRHRSLGTRSSHSRWKLFQCNNDRRCRSKIQLHNLSNGWGLFQLLDCCPLFQAPNQRLISSRLQHSGPAITWRVGWCSWRLDSLLYSVRFD